MKRTAGNLSALEQVKRSYENRRLVLCIGAGVHTGQGGEQILPNWKTLTHRLLEDDPEFATNRASKDRATIDLLLESGLTLPSIYEVLALRDGKRRRKFEAHLKDHLYADLRGLSPSSRLDKYRKERPTICAVVAFCMRLKGGNLTRNPKIQAVLNLNVDDILPSIFNHIASTEIFRTIDFTGGATAREDTDAIPVFQVHGSLPFDRRRRNSRLVFTDSDYNMTMGNPISASAQLLRAVFSTYPVLFVGTSLTDPHLLARLWEAAQTRKALSHMLKDDLLPHVLVEKGQHHAVAPVRADYVGSRGVQRLRISSWREFPEVAQEVYGRGWKSTFKRVVGN